jgi:DNA recombination protein RmuC
MDGSLYLVLIAVMMVFGFSMLRRPKVPESVELLEHLKQMQEKFDKFERDMRREVAETSRESRIEMQQSLTQFQASQSEQMSVLQKGLSDSLSTQVHALSESNSQRLFEVRQTLDSQLQLLLASNATKLDEMRQTVDEKLQSTLELRLSESFKQVAERLEQVHQGLGHMQSLAQGVGDLQRVLTNVKSRGIFGEAQLESLLEQVLTPEQYGKQVETRPRSNQRVDFAIKFPGRGLEGETVWLPIDAKFPRDDYERPRKPRPRRWRIASRRRPKASRKTICVRPRPPILPSSFCQSRVCMPRCCVAPVSWTPCSATTA